MFKFLNNNRGFSIIEALVTVFTFSILAIIIAAIFAQSLKLQRRADAVIKIQENAMFILESMAREIRVSDIFFQNNLDCTSSTVSLRHSINGNISYTFNGGVVKRIDNGIENILSSNDIEFQNLSFCITGSSLADNRPTRVTILALIKSRLPGQPTPIRLQTTVTSRSIQN